MITRYVREVTPLNEQFVRWYATDFIQKNNRAPYAMEVIMNNGIQNVHVERIVQIISECENTNMYYI